MTFEAQPTLISPLVKLRPLCLDDKETLFAVAADPLIWEQHPARSRHTKTEFDSFFSESIKSGGALLVFDAKSDDIIGSSRFYGYDEEKSEVEIGWTFLARSYWGGKYNAELKRLMFEHAFKYVEAIVFYIDPENKRSQKSVEKIGGVRDSGLDSKGRVIYRVEATDYGNTT